MDDVVILNVTQTVKGFEMKDRMSDSEEPASD